MQFRTALIAGLLFVAPATVPVFGAAKPSRQGSSAPPGAISYEKQITPLLQKYCYGCHGNGKKKGDLSLDPYKQESDAIQDEFWAHFDRFTTEA